MKKINYFCDICGKEIDFDAGEAHLRVFIPITIHPFNAKNCCDAFGVEEHHCYDCRKKIIDAVTDCVEEIRKNKSAE